MLTYQPQVQTPSEETFCIWLTPYDWTHFGTLTSGFSVSVEEWEKRFRLWIRQLENRNQKRVNYAYSIENKMPDHRHIQFALGNVSKQVTIRNLRELWDVSHAFQSKIALFDHERADEGIGYIFKDVAKGEAEGWGVRLEGLGWREVS